MALVQVVLFSFYLVPFVSGGGLEIHLSDINVTVNKDYGEGDWHLIAYNITHYAMAGRIEVKVPLNIYEVWCYAEGFERMGNTFLRSPSSQINFTACQAIKDKFLVNQFLQNFNMSDDCADWNNKVPLVLDLKPFFVDTAPFVHMLHGTGWKLEFYCQLGDDWLGGGHVTNHLDRTNIYRARKGPPPRNYNL